MWALIVILGAGCVAPGLTVGNGAEIVINISSVTIPEGSSDGFDVWLRSPPQGKSIVVNVDSDDDQSLTVSPSVIAFTADNWMVAQHVTINALVDSNADSELAYINLSAPGLPDTMATAINADRSEILVAGWPTPFDGSDSMMRGGVYCTEAPLDVAGFASSFGFFTPMRGQQAEYALAAYDDDHGKPGTFRVAMPTPEFLVDGKNKGTLRKDQVSWLEAGPLWLCMRVNRTVSLGAAAEGTSSQCRRSTLVPDISADWPNPLGASDCTEHSPVNLWVTTYHQN